MDGKTTSAPVACTLTPASQRAEIKRFSAELAPHVLKRERMEDGARLTFASVPGLRAKIERLVELDQGCCTFLNHQVESDDKIIELAIKSEGPGIPLAQDFLDVREPANRNWSGGTSFKTVTIATACGLACSAPIVLSALGLGAAGIGLGAVGIEIAAMGLIVMAVLGYWYYKRKRVHAAGKDNNANRCSC